MCYSSQPAVNRVELKDLRDLNTPVLPTSLSIETMLCLPLLHHPSILLPFYLCKKSQQTGKPLLLLFHFCQRMSILPLSLYILVPLSAIISPPLFSPSRRIYPPLLLQSNPTAINQLLFSSRGRLVSASSFLSLFTVYSIQHLHFLSSFISPPVTSSLYCSLPLSPPQALSL